MTKAQLQERIKQLEQALAWYVKEDDTSEGMPGNEYWVEGKHRAMKLLGMEIDEFEEFKE